MQDVAICSHHIFSTFRVFVEINSSLRVRTYFGITNLERINGFFMLMRCSELVPQPTGHESILLAQIPCKWNCFASQTCLLSPLFPNFLLWLNSRTCSCCCFWHLNTFCMADYSKVLQSRHRPVFQSVSLSVLSCPTFKWLNLNEYLYSQTVCPIIRLWKTDLWTEH